MVHGLKITKMPCHEISLSLVSHVFFIKNCPDLTAIYDGFCFRIYYYYYFNADSH